MQTTKPRIPIWLIVLDILSLGTLTLWPLVAFMSVFAFDAPGSAQDPAVWAGVITILSYPLLPIIGAAGSLFAYWRRHKRLSYVLAGIGAIPLVLVVQGFIAIFVGNFVFLLGG